MIIITIMMVLGMIAGMLSLVNLVVERKQLNANLQRTPHIKKKYSGTLEYKPTYKVTNSPMPTPPWEKKLSDRMILDVFGTSLYELVMQIEKEVEEEETPKVEVPEPVAPTLSMCKYHTKFHSICTYCNISKKKSEPKASPQPVLNQCDHSQFIFIVEGSSSYKSRVTCLDCGIEMFADSPNKYASAVAYSKRQLATIISIPNTGYMNAGNSL